MKRYDNFSLTLLEINNKNSCWTKWIPIRTFTNVNIEKKMVSDKQQFSHQIKFFFLFFCNCRKLLAIKVASFCRNCIVLQKLHRFAKIVSICKNCNAPRKWAGDLTKKKRKINSTILHWKSASIWMIWMTNR